MLRDADGSISYRAVGKKEVEVDEDIYPPRGGVVVLARKVVSADDVTRTR